MQGWMKPKLESRLPGEISITSDLQMTPPLCVGKDQKTWFRLFDAHVAGIPELKL